MYLQKYEMCWKETIHYPKKRIREAARIYTSIYAKTILQNKGTNREHYVI